MVMLQAQDGRVLREWWTRQRLIGELQLGEAWEIHTACLEEKKSWVSFRVAVRNHCRKHDGHGAASFL